MKGKCLKIRLITNLHMGSGESNFNFIDNQVQRDAVTTYPNMHSSGIKGALRDHFKNSLPDNEENKKYIKDIFGAENKSDEGSSQGKLSFIEGKLLALPVRSNKKSYYLGTTLELIEEYINFLTFFKEDMQEKTKILKELKKEIIFEEKYSKVYCFEKKEDSLNIEGFENKENEENKEIRYREDLADKIRTLLGIENLVIFKEEIFKEEIAKKLPVIARNYLENGESKNLWYEEVVPRESIVYTGIINSQNVEEKIFNDFISKLEEDLIQLGANATIGYGYTKFMVVK